MPVVASGLASARIRNVLARKKMPTPVMIHAISTAPAPAPCDMFCGRLNMPPPTMALTTSAASIITPSFFDCSSINALPIEYVF